jgi:23S rRNA pseudouridine1911/1915/1917 synthase
MKINILYEDKDLLVINKPAGISVHAGEQDNKQPTIADWILENYPKLKKVGEPVSKILRPGIVHRLDKETSGALIIAKNQKTFLFLKEQFSAQGGSASGGENFRIEKVYQAFVYGEVKDPKASLASGGHGVINAPIGRSTNDIRMWTAGHGAREPIREAVTEYTVLKRIQIDTDSFSFLEIYPRTGRTHQIRVHLRYINHPIVSDTLYAGNKGKALGFDRVALHAKSITFILPNDKKQTVEAPYPKDFKEAMGKYL